MTSNDERQPRAQFRTQASVAPAAADPEMLFGELPHGPKTVGALWSHQADQLREYHTEHLSTPDVALELPTGSGKTLVGLLVAEWRRRSLGHRVVYACPTKQLARQVEQKARNEGMTPVLLVGPSTEWDAADSGRYARGEAIAITTYSAIFNLRSRLGDAQTLLFDDAHAAEGYVAEAWSLTIPSALSSYTQLLDAVREALEPSFVERMVASGGPASDSSEVRLLPIAAVARREADIARVLSGLTGDSSYRYRMLAGSLSSCLIYASRQQIYIRPMIPPTFQHQPFTDAIQRIYLSATLGDAGELERAFGRTDIKKVAVPPAWEKTGSGRRFFVFPELSPAVPDPAPASTTADPDATDSDAAPQPLNGESASESDTELQAEPSNADEFGLDLAERLTAQLMTLAPKRLILTPDNDAATRIANTIGIPKVERFDAKDDNAGIQPFVDAPIGTLLAPNRYDGMDLADDACHMMLMASLPAVSHLQDRFLESKLRAPEILQERIRTRVLQGVGRCTRGPKDWSVVVVTGEDLLRFLSRKEMRQSLPVELQAELVFGFTQSAAPADELVELTRSALLRDTLWQEGAEPELARLRREATRVPHPNATQLADSARREVRAWRLAWTQEWESAGVAAVDVLEHLVSPGTRSYRALWAYLAASWYALAAGDTNVALSQRSAELMRLAQAAAAGSTWLKEVESAPGAMFGQEQADDDAVAAIATLLTGRFASATRFDRHAAQMLSNLNQKDHTKYEPGLSDLGSLLGAEAFKPPGEGRADSVWLWPTLWLTIEAKTEQENEGLLSMDYVRKTNTQLTSLTDDRDGESPPAGSASIIVTPRTVVAPDAVPIAGSHLHTAVPKLVLDLAHDTVRAWRGLRGSVARAGNREAVHEEIARIMWQHRVLPTQIRERLTRDPIRSEM